MTWEEAYQEYLKGKSIRVPDWKANCYLKRESLLSVNEHTQALGALERMGIRPQWTPDLRRVVDKDMQDYEKPFVRLHSKHGSKPWQPYYTDFARTDWEVVPETVQESIAQWAGGKNGL